MAPRFNVLVCSLLAVQHGALAWLPGPGAPEHGGLGGARLMPRRRGTASAATLGDEDMERTREILRSIRPRGDGVVGGGGEPVATSNNDRLTIRGGGPSAGPTFRTLTLFSLSAIPIFVSPTILSLIDTAAVGKASQSIAAISALGPACSACDSLTSLLTFISVGTTNLVRYSPLF